MKLPLGKRSPLTLPPAPVGGCRRCWAAGYCARYDPENPQQPPPNCPLLNAAPPPKRPAK